MERKRGKEPRTPSTETGPSTLSGARLIGLWTTDGARVVAHVHALLTDNSAATIR
jgi:hypothetical protein